jgi:lipopolysaccharide/colanic/teichoic acid biosynthesis glycosyltransferase
MTVLATSGRMKRLADVTIAVAVLLGVLPLLIVVAFALKAESAGPIFDRKSCIGRGGCRFQMLKFRTVPHDPEGTLPMWARQETRLGEFLSQTRIDALPNLYNVLRGDMSIVDFERSWPFFHC